MEKKVAIITGAGSGVGKATALALLGAGYHVTFAARRADTLEAAIAEAGADGERALAVPTDVGNPDQVRNLFAKTVEKFGRLDVLFNNAGTGARGLLEDLTDEAWLNVVNTNLNGPFYCTREAFKIMKDQDPRGGRIINNGSVSAHTPRPNSSPYTSTKHAITGLTKCIALDNRAFNIACGQLDIGNANTAMGGRMKHGVPQANGTIAPEEVMDVVHCGSAIRYMASLPLDANVLTMTIKATTMPFEGRG